MKKLKEELKALLSRLLSVTPIQYFPVTVRRGLAKGARWTLFPCSSYWRGNVEPDVQAAIRQYGSIPGGTCWDLGAHFGIYTVGMARAVGEHGEVASFEPNPVSSKRCQYHIEMNSLTWVKLYSAAASDSEGYIDLLTNEGPQAATSHIAYEDEQIQSTTRKVRVCTIVLDKLVTNGDIRPPQFIKVDVEGHGAKALRGASQTIAKYYPTLVMSFHSQWELDDTRELLEPLSYRCYTCEGEEQEWQEALYATAVLLPGKGRWLRS